MCNQNPDSKVHGANMGPTWVLPVPGGPHVGPINLAIRELDHRHAIRCPGTAGARRLVGTVLTEELDMLSSKCLWLYRIQSLVWTTVRHHLK